MRILLIEDENLAARRLEKMLRRMFEPACPWILRCATSEEALPQLRLAFDLVLLDLNLGGVKTMEWLRTGQLEAHRTLIVTAEPAHEEEARRLGVRNYLLKPVDEELLRAAVVAPSPA